MRTFVLNAITAYQRFPIFFHYVNVGPDVGEEDMITDV
jgi:hypothetical protein